MYFQDHSFPCLALWEAQRDCGSEALFSFQVNPLVGCLGFSQAWQLDSIFKTQRVIHGVFMPSPGHHKTSLNLHCIGQGRHKCTHPVSRGAVQIHHHLQGD